MAEALFLNDPDTTKSGSERFLQSLASSSPAPGASILSVTARNDRPPAAALEQSARELLESSSPGAVLLLAASSLPTLERCWKTLPAEIAVLLDPPTALGWLVVRKDVLDADSLASADDPVWEAAVRLVERDCLRIQFLSDVAVSDETRVPPLGPDTGPVLPREIRTRIQNQRANDDQEASTPERVAAQAGLLLWHSQLDASHQCSQSIEGEGRHRNGDYWHAIMHRREPDYGNSKYWFRRVGRHPIFESLAEAADRCLNALPSEQAVPWRRRLGVSNHWEPNAFVDLCEAAASQSDSPLAAVARAIQKAEMLSLLEQSWRDAGC